MWLIIGNHSFLIITYLRSSMQQPDPNSKFLSFQQDISDIELPSVFNYPFYYEPHPLSILAANELKTYLNNQTDFNHNFGLGQDDDGLIIGKMFGVMVVQDEKRNIGYLAAFSGKMAGKNNHLFFVPPVFDMRAEGSFFLTGEKDIHQYTLEIERIESTQEYLTAKNEVEHLRELLRSGVSERKANILENKKRRKVLRQENAGMLPEQQAKLVTDLSQQSKYEQIELKKFTSYHKKAIEIAQSEFKVFEDAIALLKQTRAAGSAALQQRLFENYAFLDALGNKKSLLDIFVRDRRIQPPAGAGECSAPKLLQYAYTHHLKPIAIAEFWWGQPPPAEVRMHGHFYPACRSKCLPILTHMLTGLDVEENPLVNQAGSEEQVKIIYEDEYIVVVNKAPEFLSVPGIVLTDSVLTRMKARYPDATGPLLVHRLDMSTSGILLIAKSEEAHKFLQRQFINRTIKKRYIAQLDCSVINDEGEIVLPMRVDLDDRPRQLVCYEHGKYARTTYKVISRNENKTRIHFFPHTGRTHQLRLHAAHALGLNAPITGDDIYGDKADRLYLHAEWLSFVHPGTKERMEVEVEADF